MKPTDFDDIHLPSSPNFALVAPIGMHPSPTIEARVYNMDKDKLKTLCLKVIEQQPRLKLLSKSPDKDEYSFIQRTAVFRFPDQIDIKFINLDEKSSSYIMLSRSMYGHSDFGKNKKRLLQWTSSIDKAMNET